MFKRASRLAAVALAIAAAGCSGSDGAQGPQGPQGVQGPVGPPGPQITATTEQCTGCHAGTLPTQHVLGGEVTVSNVVVAATNANADITVTYNVKVDGQNRNDFTNAQSGYTWVYPDPATVTTVGGVRTTLATTQYKVTSNMNGNYTAVLAGFGPAGATPIAAGTTIFLRTDVGNAMDGKIGALGATIVGDYGSRAHDIVGDDACMACHGNHVWAARDATSGLPIGHESANPQGVEACIVCHNRFDRAESRLGTTGNSGTATGTRLMGYVHGIHNSKNMAAGMNVDLDPSASVTVVLQNPDGTYPRNGSTNPADWFSVGFPGYMNNCSTCHNTPARLAAVANAKVSWALCMSCHNDWNGFSRTQATGDLTFHRSYQYTKDCSASGCHGAAAPATLASFHNGLKTERAGLIWDGADQSVVQGKRVVMAITGVSFDPGSTTTLAITWTATLDGTPVNPCNSSLASGPVFFGLKANAATGQIASNMSILRAYAQANDWVNGITGVTSPGQPSGAVTLAASNTTCSGTVATTRVAAEKTTAARAVVALQGKPQITFDPAVATSNEVIQIRAQTPTREFVPTTGAVPATQRRTLVSVDKCNACHLGSLYQHGGNRVDKVELCVMCHNPASSEQQNRVAWGVDPTEAYDGRSGQTYDFRTMVHAIHSAGETGAPLVYYRTNGIYFFGTKAALAKVTNWPTTGGVSCKDSGGVLVTYYKIAGSIATGTVPAADANGNCKPTAALAPSTDGTWQVHNFIEVHYPRALHDCGACHVNNTAKALPDPTQAVAVTADIGGTTASNQLDDVLVGPSAATCMSCHQSGDPTVQFGLRKHASDGGWAPSAFPNGRQTLIDAVP